MSKEIDLWADEPLPGSLPSAELLPPEVKLKEVELKTDSKIAPPDFDEPENLPWGMAVTMDEVAQIPENHSASIMESGDDLLIHCRIDLSRLEAFRSLHYVEHARIHGGWKTKLKLTPNSALVLRSLLPSDTNASGEIRNDLRAKLSELRRPEAWLSDTGKHIDISIPNLKYYREIMNKLGAYPLRSGEYRLLIDKALDLEAMASGILEDSKRNFPAIRISDDVLQLNRDPIPGFTGNIDELRSIPISVLNVVSADIQSWKQKKGNSKTMEDKLQTMGLSTLYDLLFWMPRRYIDKSDPQDLSDLIDGESATILGTIINSSTIPNEMGAKFEVELVSGKIAEIVFWRQGWLRNKFPKGSEVIITGKFGWYRGKPTLSGSSIDHSDEVALLPIVPVYKQSESKGVTTKFILSAIREMLSRLGDFPLPEYLRAEDRPSYSETLRELHFPTSIENHGVAVDALAYYELVLMQIQLQSSRVEDEIREGLAQAGGGAAQEAAISSFPWPLTDSQKEAISRINSSMAKPTPSRILLNSDVGTGKTVVAQLAALRAVDSGRQAVLAAPTEVLARQLHSTFAKLVDGMDPSIRPSYGLIVGGIPMKERNALKKSAKDGDLDVLIGTHTVLTGGVKYKDLGFIAIDEQQKFGAEQRTLILNSRDDGRVPDMLMQSATPIPRSMAQVFFGEMEMIALKGKPNGRKTIITEWVEEDPRDVISMPIHPLWADLKSEAAQGNQSFVVTPMVNDSPKVDAASVEHTFKTLKSIFGMRIGMVHGQMKVEEQRKTMELFREKSYDILVASTVVEVGVDIPDATRVVVLSADRFGASSLHQVRGRAGRNSKQAKCYLVSLGKTKSAQTRLQSMVEHADGFEIARVDLETRGEGKIFSTNQAGATELIFASLASHSERIPEAQIEAAQILSGEWAAKAIEDSAVRFKQEIRLA